LVSKALPGLSFSQRSVISSLAVKIENGDEGGSALETVYIVQAAPSRATVPEAPTSVAAFYHLP
jgi:hypothetical protein